MDCVVPVEPGFAVVVNVLDMIPHSERLEPLREPVRDLLEWTRGHMSLHDLGLDSTLGCVIVSSVPGLDYRRYQQWI